MVRLERSRSSCHTTPKRRLGRDPVSPLILMVESPMRSASSTRPAATDTRDVFPQPDGPIQAVNSPGDIFDVISDNTVVRCSFIFVPKHLRNVFDTIFPPSFSFPLLPPPPPADRVAGAYVTCSSASSTCWIARRDTLWPTLSSLESIVVADASMSVATTWSPLFSFVSPEEWTAVVIAAECCAELLLSAEGPSMDAVVSTLGSIVF
mmetsp:Transcript_40137/g.84288  ORF Transcript_40137/g.84288 Transcript_40137/m.84288 type:complete len:207 (-) Transcript_40137:35-655(-)